MVGALQRGWTWLTDDHVPFCHPSVEKLWTRCVGCGRVFPHYQACMTKADRDRGRRIGCKCGASKSRRVELPFWYETAWMLYALIWRKWIKGEQFWDPRFNARKADAHV